MYRFAALQFHDAFARGLAVDPRFERVVTRRKSA